MTAYRTTCRFPRGHIMDGWHDSICVSCYATLASVRNEADLARHEQPHLCDTVLLNCASQSAECAVRALVAGVGVTFHHSPPSSGGVLLQGPGHRTF